MSLFTLILISVGCGLKGDPIPSRIKPPAAIADLSAASSREGVLLKWSLTDPLEKIGAFQLLRSGRFAEARRARSVRRTINDTRRYPPRMPAFDAKGKGKFGIPMRTSTPAIFIRTGLWFAIGRAIAARRRMRPA